ncbi:MAG: uroporphyrinogen-III synthase [Candidatus Binatia bacterium]
MGHAVSYQIDNPLIGRRIVVTRPRAQAQSFVELLEQYGAEVVIFPTIETVPVASYARLDAALDQIATYDWLVFTSVNGVRYFLERLFVCHKTPADLQHLKIATIGPETARAVTSTLTLEVNTVPGEYRAEALVAGLGDVRGQRILIPRAAEAREVLPQQLQALGAQVDEIHVYQTTLPPQSQTQTLRQLLHTAQVAMLTFTSSSTVRNFATIFAKENLPALVGKTSIGCIGPITGDTAREYGLTVAVQSQVYTIPAFAEAIVEYFRNET